MTPVRPPPGRLRRSAMGGLLCLAAPIASLAQTSSEPPVTAPVTAPLSVIDWLGTQTPPSQGTTPTAFTPDPNESDIARSALPPEVTVATLGEGGPRQIGLVPPHVTGLPTTLWRGSDLEVAVALLSRLPEPQLPAAQALLYTVLLAEADAPGLRAAAGDRLARARVEKLMELGAIDPASSLIEQAGVPTSAAHFDLWMQLSLLNGTEDRACALLRGAPHLTQDYGTRILCTARAGQWDNAALTFGSAQALNLLPDEKLALLDRFLHPDAFEDSAPMVAPREMDPLNFRLFEAIGEPLPTRTLPRAYAVADLRDLAGWKSQVEAAERLTRAGALPDNVLLGLYTDRQPAASGGVWDRIAALQRFDTALTTKSEDAVIKALPPAWKAMREAGLEISFANLFAADLEGLSLTGSAAEIAQKIALLSPEYERAAAEAEQSTLATQLARGEVTGSRPKDPMHAALHDAFSTDAAPRADLVAMARQDRLAESILHVLSLLHDGTQGDTLALRDALATLRRLGLEDTARRAALQILLLGS